MTSISSQLISEKCILELEFVTVRLMTNIAVAPNLLLRTIEMLCTALSDPVQTTHLNANLSRCFFEKCDQQNVKTRSRGGRGGKYASSMPPHLLRPIKIDKKASPIQFCATAIVDALIKWSNSCFKNALWPKFCEPIRKTFPETVYKASAQWLHDLAEKIHCAQTGSLQIPRDIETGVHMIRAKFKNPVSTKVVTKEPKKGSYGGGLMKAKMIHNCAICGNETTTKCQRCKRAYYCCREHQVEAWSSHKSYCKGLEAMRKNTKCEMKDL